MTAEIAVLNRFAVALAADSAVTIGDGSDTKIFQSENKLFQLSDDHPIGVMLYNATSYFGIPWELIIKDFREKHKDMYVEKLFDVVPIFLDFICRFYKPNEAMQVLFLRRIIIEKLTKIHDSFSNKVFHLMVKRARSRTANKELQSFFNQRAVNS